MKCEDKESIGSSPCHALMRMSCFPDLDQESLGCLVNSNEASEDSCIGNSSWHSTRKGPFELFKDFYPEDTTNSAVPKQPPPTVPRKIREYGDRLNMAQDPSNVTLRLIGNEYGIWQRQAVLKTFLPISEFHIIGNQFYLTLGHSEQFLRTIRNRLRLSELAMYSGVQLELASLGVLGKRRHLRLTLRIHEQNSGMGIMVKNLLSSMNLEAELTLDTSYDGWTATQSVWRLKGPQPYSVQLKSGSRATSTQGNGTHC